MNINIIHNINYFSSIIDLEGSIKVHEDFNEEKVDNFSLENDWSDDECEKTNRENNELRN